MTNIRILRDTPLRYPHDCERIVEIMRERGYHCTLEQAEELWDKASDSVCAGWLIVDGYDDDDVFSRISGYFEPVPEPRDD